MKTKDTKLYERMFTQGFLGFIAGLLILHPLSMFIHEITENTTPIFNTFINSYSPEHFVMAGYFAILGGIIGVFRAIYTHKKTLLYEKMRFLSITDELTSLYNRRYFIEHLDRELERARRYSHNLSIIMIDLDDFKHYNDTFGHHKGDELLKQFGVFLKGSIRSPDFAARYGGDEFVIVMTESDKKQALRLVERLHKGINRLPFNKAVVDQGNIVTASIGVATFPEDAEDIDGLFRIADSRLFMAKNNHGNKDKGGDDEEKTIGGFDYPISRNRYSQCLCRQKG